MSIPDDLSRIPGVAELGGAVGRTASVECKQGQHDLCVDSACMCRHHERHPADAPRCSADRPCPVKNPIHMMLWGECFVLVDRPQSGRADG